MFSLTRPHGVRELLQEGHALPQSDPVAQTPPPVRQNNLVDDEGGQGARRPEDEGERLEVDAQVAEDVLQVAGEQAVVVVALLVAAATMVRSKMKSLIEH